jgi:hypothetical protein
MRMRRELGVSRWVLLACAVLMVTAVVGCKPGADQETVMADTPKAFRVMPEQVKVWLDEGDSVTFVDSRNPNAWRSGTTKAPGAIRVPAADVASHLAEIPRDGRIVVYCT